MTIQGYCWPRDKATKRDLEQMIEYALAVDETWRPPAEFTYEWRNNYVNLTGSVDSCRRNAGRLFATLPESAKYMYYAGALLDGVTYSMAALASLEEHGLTNAEALKPLLPKVESLLEHLQRISQSKTVVGT